MFTLEDIQGLRKKTGIYFLIKNDVVVYVGQSIDIYTRVLEHKFENKKEFDNVKALVIEDNTKREIYEMSFISILKPKCNILSFELKDWYNSLPSICKTDSYENIHNRTITNALRMDNVPNNDYIVFEDAINYEAISND